MIRKLEMLFIAQLYSQNYQQIIALHADPEQWAIVTNKDNIARKIQRNLAKIALTKTKQTSFTQEQLPAIKQDLLDYHNHYIHI